MLIRESSESSSDADSLAKLKCLVVEWRHTNITNIEIKENII